jgi:hypothetical protein
LYNRDGVFTARYGLGLYMLFRSILSFSHPLNVRTPSRNEPLMTVTKPDALHRPLPNAPVSLFALKSSKYCKTKCHPLRFLYSSHTNAVHMQHTAQLQLELLFKWRHDKPHTVSPNVTLYHQSSHCITKRHTVSPNVTLYHQTSHFITKCHTVSPNVTLYHHHPLSHVYFTVLYVDQTSSVKVSWKL